MITIFAHFQSFYVQFIEFSYCPHLYITSNVLEYMNRAHLISDFIKNKSPQPGLEPTKMRQYRKNSMSPLHECFSRMKIEVINFSGIFLFWKAGARRAAAPLVGLLLPSEKGRRC